MSALLRDLYGHQAWADAEHWRALEAHPPALEDARLRERLHHIHHVQRIFLWVVRDQPARFAVTRPEDFASPTALKEYARTYHGEVAGFLGSLDEAGLARRVRIPFFKD